MRPLIGITAGRLVENARDFRYQTSAYFNAVEVGGGIPVLLPFCENEGQAGEILERIDGLLLSGGVDVDPLLFGEQPHPRQGEISPDRDATEMAMVRVALQRNMPVLGICRGHQVLAVAAGGTLWQDLPKQVPNAIKHAQQAPRYYPTHTVTVKPGTRLAAILGAGEFKVNTFHHQAVKAVPPGFVACATAPDGMNEALEHPGYKFVLSVQWHPENFAGRPYNFDALFRAFVSASQR